MNWKLLWFRMTGQKRRAGGVRAAITRKDNEAKKRLRDATEADFNKAFIVQPPSQVPPQAGVIGADAGASPERA